jgi:peptidylprolyl isomerase
MCGEDRFVPTEKQRREAARRHLERQLERRQERALRRRKTNLYLSIGGTLVLVAAIIVTVVLVNNGSDKKKPQAAASSPAPTSTAATTPATSSSPAPVKSYGAAKGASVTFDGVTVKGAADTSGVPLVTIKPGTDPTKIEYKDLVVGTGKSATPSSSVTAQYVGSVYKTGKVFQSSWNVSNAVPFTLGPGNVIDGFTDGIGGTTGVPPMHAGGRRIIIMPAALAYGASPPSGSGIPANATLVFVVDLASVTS